MQYQTQLNNLDATQQFAGFMADAIEPNFVVTLTGDLGSGKTTLVRGILYALGVTGSVKSPTYTIVEPYNSGKTDIYHFDLYRFNNPEEWFDSGFDEYFVHHSICFIEWAEKAYEYIPVIDWQLKITVADEIRYIEINTTTEKGAQCLHRLIQLAGK